MLISSATLNDQARKVSRAEGPIDFYGVHADDTVDFGPTESPRAPTASELNQRGTSCFRAGDHESALAAFNLAIELQADYPEAYNNRGFTRETIGDREGALADYSVAIELNPNYVESHTNRAGVRHALGEYEAALVDYDRALTLAPVHAAGPIYHGRGGVLLTKREFDSAIADLNRAIQLDPRLWPAYVSRANARYHKADPGAVDDYWMAMQIEPDLAAREIVRKIATDLESGARAVLLNCERHLRTNSRDRLSRARRGLTLLLLDRAEEAATDLAMFMQQAPDCESQLCRLLAEVGRQRTCTAADSASRQTFDC